MNIVNFKAPEVLVNMFKEEKARLLAALLTGVVLTAVAAYFLTRKLLREEYQKGHQEGKSQIKSIVKGYSDEQIPVRSLLIQQIEAAPNPKYPNPKDLNPRDPNHGELRA